MNASPLSRNSVSADAPSHISLLQPAKWFLAGVSGLLALAVFSCFLGEGESARIGEFLKGQVGFDGVFSWLFVKMALGFALGAMGGFFVFREIPQPHRPGANRIALLLALYFIPVVIYIPAMTAGFIWDDDQEISANVSLQPVADPANDNRPKTNWRGLWEIWTGGITSEKDTDAYRLQNGHPPAPFLVNMLRPPLRWVELQIFGGSDKANYRFTANQSADYFPLKTSMLWVEYQLWGYYFDPSGRLIANAPPFHIMNILIHALDGVLLWMVLRQLKVPGAWLGALLFAIHPVHSESVAWIAERKNTLSLFFCLLSTSAWLRYEDGGKRKHYVLSLLLFACALLCKTHVVVFPAVLMLLTWWRTGRETLRDFGRDFLQKAPFFALALVLALVTIWFQNDRAIGGEVIPIGNWASRLAGAGVVVWAYLSKALLPINLNTIYANTPYLWWPLTNPQPWMFLSGALVLSTLGLLWAIKTLYPSQNPVVSRTPFFVFAYFVGTLFPVLGFFTMSYMRLTLQADHFQYFSDIAVVALAGALIATAYEKAQDVWRPVVAAATLVLVLSFSAYSWERAGVHQGEKTLWEACLKKNEASWQAHNHIGAVYYGEGRIPEAAPHFARAVELKPENPEVHNNLGLAFWYYKRYDEAIAQYREAVRIKGEVLALRRNLADALVALNRWEDALEQYKVILNEVPNDSMLHGKMGVIYAQTGRYYQAGQEFETALRLNPQNAMARQNLEIMRKMLK